MGIIETLICYVGMSAVIALSFFLILKKNNHNEKFDSESEKDHFLKDIKPSARTFTKNTDFILFLSVLLTHILILFPFVILFPQTLRSQAALLLILFTSFLFFVGVMFFHVLFHDKDEKK